MGAVAVDPGGAGPAGPDRTAGGLGTNEIVRRSGASKPTVIMWKKRYAAEGWGGLADRPKPGRPRVIDDVAIVLAMLELPPARLGVTHWSSRLLAAEMGISNVKVADVWREWGLQPWRAESFRFSADPQLEAKARDVIGLYLNPPDKAVVLCVDEKPQTQALERKARCCRCGPEKRSHDYIRHGTTALEAVTGKVTGACYPQHRRQEFLAFLRQGVPAPQAAPGLRQLPHAHPPGRTGLLDKHPGSPCTSRRRPDRG